MVDKKKKRDGIATLSDLKRAPDSDSDSDGQEYYTGGEKSGMVVQDPGSNKQNKNKADVDSIFDRARELGAQKGSGDVSSSSSGRAKSGAFAGVGRTLAGGEPAAAAAAAPGEDSAPEPVFHTITFWRNGFTVNDGALRRLDDPANLPFLQSIHRGECPRELDSRNPNIPVHVNLMKRDADWTPPVQPQQYFFGAGRTLGQSEPSAASNDDDASAAAATSTPFRGIVVDEQKPFTSIQLRLADGTRMVARFNSHHTVGDIRGFIDAARVGGPKAYSLQVMGFPPKVLSDASLSIQDAGLSNAVVIQKNN